MGKVHSLTHDLAIEMLVRAEKMANEAGKTAILIFVDYNGKEITKIVMDGAYGFLANEAMLKARQSSRTGKTTKETAEEISDKKTTPAILGISQDRLIEIPGGLPIYDDESNLLGAVGMSCNDNDHFFSEMVLKKVIEESNLMFSK